MSTPPKQEVKKKKYLIVQSTNLAITEQTKTRTSMKKLTNTFSKEKKNKIYVTINAPQEFKKTKQNLQHIEQLQFYSSRTLFGGVRILKQPKKINN